MANVPTKTDLTKLPLRAIVGYAARSARRVQALYDLAVKSPNFARHQKDVESAISLAEQFCAPAPDAVTAAADDAPRAAAAAAYAAADAAYAYDDADADAKAAAAAVKATDAAAHAAIAAAHAAVATDAAAYAADATDAADVADAAVKATDAAIAAIAAAVKATAADAAIDAADAIVTDAAAADYERLLRLNLGTFPHLGEPIDVTGQGPLGEIWPVVLSLATRSRLAKSKPEEPISIMLPALEVFVDPGEASKETIQALLEALSDLNRAAGGLGLEFSIDGQFVIAREEALV